MNPSFGYRTITVTPFAVIENPTRRIGGDKQYERHDGREPQNDRRATARDGKHEGRRYGNEESRRDKTPPLKKFEETKAPVS